MAIFPFSFVWVCIVFPALETMVQGVRPGDDVFSTRLVKIRRFCGWIRPVAVTGVVKIYQTHVSA
jgi:hypothetical protein